MKQLKLDHQKVLELLPDRKVDSHKGDYGRILLLCGSVGYTGAPALAAMGALRSGAGLVYLGVPQSIYTIEAIKLTEAMVFPLPDHGGKLSRDSLNEILSRLEKMDAVLIGPGLGQSEDVKQVVHGVLRRAKCPVVLDADGINMMKAHMDILRERNHPTILTPHAGEFDRIGGDPLGNRAENAMSFARDNQCVLLLKGHETVITDGETCYINETGNPGMATGGSGDVLSGIIVSLLGQKLDPLTAAACGAWIHGRAGDICARELGQYGMLPGDMVEVLPRLMK